MAFKRDGIIARPGAYKYKDKEEFKTAEELERIASLQGEIMLTLGHPDGGLPSQKDYIGKVFPKWDSEKQILKGDFWFYDEYLDKLPPAIRDRVVNRQEVSISTGFKLDGVEDGTQKGALYSHVAILLDEDPLCPLGQCGINVRQESSDLTYRYEEKSEITEETGEPLKPREVRFSEAQMLQLTELVTSLITPPKETVAVAETEPVEEPAVAEIEAEEPPAPTPPEPKGAPETVIPASQPASKEGEFVDGVMVRGYSILGGKPKEK